eukprot:TRINITY_DN59_c0_g2_i1.p1 TRINITY_DN59_c0_g2~~TRINITY_DN59_c0_g2_i1.p1  ORF type:complete len:123 (+),score=29.84 TRINITY_DN59_c0_g2_i1:461-829(+)
MASFLRSSTCHALLGRRLTAVRPAMVRGGAGMPVGTSPAPTAPLPETEELTWDDGTPYPDDCIDNWAPMFTKEEGLTYLLMGLSGFGLLAGAAAFNNKAARIPWTPREYPYDNLRVELGGEP